MLQYYFALRQFWLIKCSFFIQYYAYIHQRLAEIFRLAKKPDYCMQEGLDGGGSGIHYSLKI